MAQNSEQIEAKLCAYLEGELDAQGRVEIEKHLEQNPAHRKLLEEVGKTQGLLRALPREPAPSDVCEAFQGQLERSVLLADLDEGATGSSMKINRWPQYLAVAAIVVLSVGLGLVVYFGLPSGPPQAHYAVGGNGAGGATQDGVASKSLGVDGTAPTSTGVTGETPLAAAPETSPTEPDALRDRDKVSVALGETAEKLAESVAADPAAQDLTVLARRVQGAWEPKERERLFNKGPVDAARPEATRWALASVPSNALYYRVTSPQPAATSDEIGQELSRMEVAWEVVVRPDLSALQSKLGAAGSAAGVAGEAADKKNADVLVEADAATGAPAIGNTFAGRSARFHEGAGDTVAQKQESADAGDAPAARGPSPAPANQEAQTAAKPSTPATDAPATPSRHFAFGLSYSRRPETMIVARNLTRQQADTLGKSLSEGRPERAVMLPTAVAQAAPELALTDEAALAKRGLAVPAAPAPTTSAADAVIRQGDSLRLVRWGTRGEEAVAELKVGQDGSVEVPGLGALQCAGLTLRQLQERLNASPAAAGRLEQVVAINKVEPKFKDAAVEEKNVPAAVALNESRGTDRAVRRARNEVTLRAQSAPESSNRASGEQPVTAMRPAPTSRGGAAGAPAQEVKKAYDGALADVAATTDSEKFAQEREATAPGPGGGAMTAPTQAADRFDVVILVEAPDDAAVPGATPPAAEEPAPEPTGPIQKHEILMIQLGQDEADTANVRVAQDGTVEVPGVGPLTAEGLSSAELKAQIEEKLRRNAADPQKVKVVVTRVGPVDPAPAAPAEGDKTSTETPADGNPPTTPADPPPTSG